MLIELDREVPGVLMQGVHCDLHWRVVRDVDTWQFTGAGNVFCVYLQSFVPMRDVGIATDGGRSIPARYNPDTTDGVMVSWSPDNDDLTQQQRLQWVEVYYGKLWMSSRGNNVAAAMSAAWYPHKRADRDGVVRVLPKTFMKHMQASAHYLCGFMDFFSMGGTDAGLSQATGNSGYCAALDIWG